MIGDMNQSHDERTKPTRDRVDQNSLDIAANTAAIKRLEDDTPVIPPVIPPVEPPIIPPPTGERRFGINAGYKVDKDWSTDKPDEPGYNRILKPVAKGQRVMDQWETNNDLNSGGGIKAEAKAMLLRQIDMCNELGSTLYLCLLFHDNEDTIRWKMTTINTRLNPNLGCYVEWANEPWNSGTNVHEELVRLTGPIPLSDGKTRRPHIGDVAFQKEWAKHASFALSVAKDAMPRCTTVLGCLTANPWIAKKVEQQMTFDVDAHGLTFYFGSGLGGTPDPNTTVAQILASSSAKIDAKEIPRMREHAAFSKSLGRRIVGYEGLSHYTINPKLHTSHANVWRNMNQANRDPGIIPLCDRMVNAAESFGYEMLFIFNFLTRYDQWGSWGLGENLETIEQAEKYKYAAGI